MADKNIYILSIPADFHYSRNLSEWISKRKNADGIISGIFNNEKYFEIISSRERKIQNVVEEPFTTEMDIYGWANTRIVEISKKNPNWIIIDGIGNVEVRGQGLFSSITEVIQKAKRFNKINVLFIVPADLTDIFINYFDIDLKNGKLITLAELMKLKHG